MNTECSLIFWYFCGGDGGDGGVGRFCFFGMPGVFCRYTKYMQNNSKK